MLEEQKKVNENQKLVNENQRLQIINLEREKKLREANDIITNLYSKIIKLKECITTCMKDWNTTEKHFVKQIVSENDKLKKLFNLKNDEEVINEEEITPTIKQQMKKKKKKYQENQ